MPKVFELLSHSIPGLSMSRDNWQSSVRTYVTAHPEYADMRPWSGYETSDIVYVDRGGILTKLLIEKDYLSREVWEGKQPRYFIEVKTTTSRCETPFYMSRAQYQRVGPPEKRAQLRNAQLLQSVADGLIDAGQCRIGSEHWCDIRHFPGVPSWEGVAWVSGST